MFAKACPTRRDAHRRSSVCSSVRDSMPGPDGAQEALDVRKLLIPCPFLRSPSSAFAAFRVSPCGKGSAFCGVSGLTCTAFASVGQRRAFPFPAIPPPNAKHQ
ncbi:hypothetical protein ERJ75_001096000 [Trypanosoma vivax]|nr:hypothetical protein ERJ75_001096000 [Trypanosoma vivax]